ncbi:MAG: tetratricopeptide repeat protein [Spirochaetaceae bacterium]|jgi:tetratricopeptide (TPR) repeat protein|nr:tetratricopeptide repeat protein [Spirochaetaceae bacterium]GMO23954.1 MAG: tetratricopeptide repeat protein [Termitinemataceae bacterium]
MLPKYEEAVKYFNMKRWDSALQAFQEVDASGFTSGEKADLAYYLGLCYTKLERYNDAVLYLEQVVAGDSGNLRICQCRITLAFIYLNTKRYKMADFELDRLVKGGVKSSQIFTMLGFSAWNQNQNERAVEYYEKALEIEASNTTAMNALGFILADTGQDADRGVSLCKQAVEKKPNSPSYLDSLGWAYYKAGDMNEARSYIRRALDLAPKQKEISNHMKIIVGGETP